MGPTDTFSRARDLLFAERDDYGAAYAKFRWPALDRFNWALDWFDAYARGNSRTALHIADDKGAEVKASFAELSERSNRIANWLRGKGVRRGDRVLLMLSNVRPLWEVMLAAMKLGAVVVPCSMQLVRKDVEERVSRGEVKHAIVDASVAERFGGLDAVRTRLVIGEAEGWTRYEDALASSAAFVPDGETRASDPFLLYFTSGTTAKPKLVLHTHASYPVGHLSTLYWIGMREGDVHQNISSPGWAKHAWSSFFAPWNAGATIFVLEQSRFSAQRTVEWVRKAGVATLCAPPTVWRMMILDNLGERPAGLRELVSAGEPLNPEVIEHVRRDWNLTIRDGYGQTETTAQVGNTPGQEVRLGSMGRPLPGYQVALLDSQGREASEGEVSLKLEPRPLGLMVGYVDDAARTAAVMAGGYYRTGDEASRDEAGYYHYVGRGDDVFKSSDYRISPFELESVLIEHPAVAEAAIVPSPDPVRTSTPKAFVALKPGVVADAETAREILAFCKEKLAPYKRIRCVEFAELPKTISGKIRRVQLRNLEKERRATGERAAGEYWLDDLERKG
ncbi:MAG TPA: AMP-binding protein [Myxococcales bacterium]|nr:AMP-binding protein [Myxococcales bacterium]